MRSHFYFISALNSATPRLRGEKKSHKSNHYSFLKFYSPQRQGEAEFIAEINLLLY